MFSLGLEIRQIFRPDFDPEFCTVYLCLVANLIFVTDTRTVSVEKKSVMWRIFKFLYMTDEEKSKISPHGD